MAALGLLAALAGATGDLWKIASVCVYGFANVLLFAASTMYHSARSPSLRRRLRVLDHVSINLLIAGTYTPFLLVNLRASWGWGLFAAIWILALLGVVGELFLAGKFKLFSTLLYLAMGWIIVFAIGPLMQNMSHTGVVLLFAGGVGYSLGAAFYLLDKKIPFGHAIWHLFVLGASVCHVLSVILGVLPYKG